jgi:leucyl aminopeptidase
MKVKFWNDPTALPTLECDLLALPVEQETFSKNAIFAALDERLGGLLTRLAGEERFQGKPGQSLTVHTHGKVGAQRVMLAGTGPAADLDAAELRNVAARAARACRSISARHVAVVIPSGVDLDRAAQFAAEGIHLGRYKFDRYLSEEGRRPDLLETATLALPAAAPSENLERAVKRAEVVAAAVARARDLVNEPAGEMTPRRMAEFATRLAAETGLTAEIFGPTECREMGMGMYLAVAQGSDEEPRFIHLAYKPKDAKKKIALVGKGVTFDSGGLSLKPSQAMEDMKVDMAGAAAVVNAIAALAQLGVPYEVHAIAACTENMPSGKAYKLGDVLRSMAGKTVEINNTDAEGRLTLGDAIAFAKQRLQPDEIFDFATLTGACVVALGPHTAGVMSNTPGLAERWLAAAKAAGEEMWHLPLPDRLKEQLKSEVADMRNTGERHGGALTAGLFLKEFAGDTPWVHVDIAGPATADKEHGAQSKGATGFAVATIVEYLAGRP